MTTPPAFDARLLAQLRDDIGDDAAFSELIETFLGEAPGLLELLEQGATARDARVMERAAHTLKSTSATFGASSLARACDDVEKLGRQGNADGVRSRVPELERMYEDVRLLLKAESQKHARE